MGEDYYTLRLNGKWLRPVDGVYNLDYGRISHWTIGATSPHPHALWQGPGGRAMLNILANQFGEMAEIVRVVITPIYDEYVRED